MSEETKQCPFCGEEIRAVAKKCKNCGNWLEDSKEKYNKVEDISKTVETFLNIPWRSGLHGISLIVCLISCFCGLGMFFKGEIVIIDACIYMCEWLVAIFFLLLWKFTGEK